MKHNPNLVVGRPDVALTTPSHVKGVHEGNWPTVTKTSPKVSRSTGINADEREPIDPAMPRLSPP